MAEQRETGARVYDDGSRMDFPYTAAPEPPEARVDLAERLDQIARGLPTADRIALHDAARELRAALPFLLGRDAQAAGAAFSGHSPEPQEREATEARVHGPCPTCGNPADDPTSEVAFYAGDQPCWEDCPDPFHRTPTEEEREATETRADERDVEWLRWKAGRQYEAAEAKAPYGIDEKDHGDRYWRIADALARALPTEGPASEPTHDADCGPCPECGSLSRLNRMCPECCNPRRKDTDHD